MEFRRLVPLAFAEHPIGRSTPGSALLRTLAAARIDPYSGRMHRARERLDGKLHDKNHNTVTTESILATRPSQPRRRRSCRRPRVSSGPLCSVLKGKSGSRQCPPSDHPISRSTPRSRSCALGGSASRQCPPSGPSRSIQSAATHRGLRSPARWQPLAVPRIDPYSGRMHRARERLDGKLHDKNHNTVTTESILATRPSQPRRRRSCRRPRVSSGPLCSVLKGKSGSRQCPPSDHPISRSTPRSRSCALGGSASRQCPPSGPSRSIQSAATHRGSPARWQPLAVPRWQDAPGSGAFGWEASRQEPQHCHYGVDSHYRDTTPRRRRSCRRLDVEWSAV